LIDSSPLGVERFADPLRQVRRLEDLRVGEHHGPLDRVLELAHVARPRVVHEQLARVGGEPADVRAQARVVLRDEVVDQQVNVLAPLPQRRDRDRQHVDPVE
jgi:hypothetical protein